MIPLPRFSRLAAAGCVLAATAAISAPVAVNDAYTTNEDTILTTNGADIISAKFESAGNVLSGEWQFLDRIKNSQAGQTPDTYPVDSVSRKWNVPAFDTATSTVGPWGSGVLPLQGGGINGFPGAPDVLKGYGTGGANYTITTYLFRKTFTLDVDAAARTEWVLRHLVDDGAIFYINGQEVHRYNLRPGEYTPEGPVTTDTYANSSIPDESFYSTEAISIPAGLLVAGPNVMAVEVHQGGGLSSTDIGLDCELSAPGVDTGGFVYEDDTTVYPGAGRTSRPECAAGAVDPDFGNPGSSLLVSLTRSFGGSGPGISGGWRRTFTLGSPAQVRIAVSATVRMLGGLEAEEFGEARLKVNDTYYGADENGSLLHLTGTEGDAGWPPVPFLFDISLGAGTHTISLEGLATRPSADDETVRVYFDNLTLTVKGSGNSLLVNDTGGAVSAQLVDGPAHGTLSLAADGNFSYMPAPNYFGADSFTYRTRDAGSAQSGAATVNITVNSVNDAPLAAPDSYTTNQGATLNVNAATGVLANDTDADTPVAQRIAQLVTSPLPSEGALTLNANGSFIFVPAAGFHGPSSFVYRVSDGIMASSDVKVDLTIVPVGNPPVASADRYTTARNNPLVVNALVPDSVTEDIIPFGSEAVVSEWRYLDDGSNQGTAWRAKNFNDSAWKTGGGELGYGNGDEVTEVEDNAEPGYTQGASDRFATTYFRRKFNVQNRFDIIFAQVSLIYDDGGVIYLNGAEYNRTWTMGGEPEIPFDFYCGNSSNNETVDFDLSPELLLDGENQMAVEIHQTQPTSSDISLNLRLRVTRSIPAGLLANDVDPDQGSSLTVSTHTSPAHGTLALNPNGTFTYTPAPGYTGPDSFTYRCTDGTETSAVATVTIDVVLGPNVRPAAQADTYAATEDTALTVAAAGGVLANDTDADGDARTAMLVAGPASGNLALSPNGSFVYTPAANATGPVTFTYTANDAAGPSEPAMVTINITNVNDAPAAVNDVYATDPGAALIVPVSGVLTNDTDPDPGAVLTAQIVTPPAQGTLTLNSNGSFNYAPPAAFTGTVTFTYRASDGTANSGNATVTIKVNGRPAANANTYGATEDTPLVINAPGVLSNDTDPENDSLTAQADTPPAHGTLTLAANGGFTYTPEPNYNGADFFTYRAFDGARESVTAATVTLSVTPVNDAPVANGDTYATPEETTLSVPVLTGVLNNDTDVDSTALTAQIASQPVNGAATVNPDGSFIYTPNAGFSGLDTFTYTTSDGTAASTPATVSVSVGVDLAKVVINEIHYHPQSLSAGDEFIEIFNANPGPVDLSGWQFDSGVNYTFPAGVTIAANGYLVLAADPVQFTATFGSVTALRGPWTGGLSNSGERIRLITASGAVVSELEYADQGDWAERRQVSMGGQTSWEWYTRSDAEGSSLELINASLPGDRGQNWASSTAGPTPGRVNSVAAADIAPILYDVGHRPQIPRSPEPVTITVNALDEAATPPAVSLFWRVSAASPGAFTQAAMADDGEHGDGNPGDGEYGAIIPPHANGTVIEFYVSATDAGNRTRTWPAAGRNLADTDYIQAANAFYQVDEEVWANQYPIYRLIGTASDVSRYLGSWNRNSDAQLNVTFVGKQGTDIDVIYRSGLRVRGAGSRGNSVNNWRLDFPKDDKWNDESEANLNVWHTHLGDLASKMMEMSGLIHERSWPVQVRLNATNRALSNSEFSNGYFIHLQPGGSEYLKETRPSDDNGNYYKKARPHQDWTVHEASPGGPPDNSGYVNDGWIKQTNEDLNDYTDIHALMRVFDRGVTPTVQEMEAVMNVDYWLRWLAFQTIVNHNETNLSNGANDDYGLYRGVTDPRFIPLAHDFDTVWGDGGNTSGLDPTSPDATIYQMTGNFSSGETIDRLSPLYRDPVMNQRFKAQLVDLLNTVFRPSTFDAMVESTLGNWTGPTGGYGVSASKRNAIKSFNMARREYILQTVLGYSSAGVPPPALTLTCALPVQSGYPRAANPGDTGLSGTVDSSRVQKVRIGTTGIFPDNYQSMGGGEGGNGPAPWSAGSAVRLLPGINHLTVQALGPNDAVLSTQYIDIWLDDGLVQAVGSINGNTTWTSLGGPYRVTSSLTIDNETLTIQPGTTVYFNQGTSLNVTGTGRILAEGSAVLPVRLMREPGGAGKWGQVNINGASLESRFAWVIIDGAGTSPAINLTGSTGHFDHIDFVNTAVQYFSSASSSFVFQNSNFPSAAGFRAAGGSGVPAAGYAVFRGNTFGGTTGLNDLIEFTGGQRPNAILQVLDNTFLNGSDDALDLDGTDAHIEGNVFLNIHQAVAGADTSAAIAGGADGAGTSELTVVRNLFWNCDHALLATGGNFYTVVNNTIVNINNTASAAGSSAGAFKFHEPARAGITPALGMMLDGNIVVSSPVVFENAASATGAITANRNMLPADIAPPVTGTGNLTTAPLLAGATGVTVANIRAMYALQPGSPAEDSGPNGQDRGATVPSGASISGEPAAHRPSQSAVLTIGGPGITHYRFSLDGGPFGAETAVTVPLTLSALSTGTHSVRVIGKNSAGVWQAETAATQSLTWTVNATAQPVVINEVLAGNVNAWPVGTLRPDFIELRNLSGTAVSLDNWSVSDDPLTAEAPAKYLFPAGRTLAPGGFLVLSSEELGFNLDADGDAVYLYSGATAGSPLIDSVVFGFQVPDKSLSRTGNDRRWTLGEVTPAAANTATPLGRPQGLRINEWLGANEMIVEDDFVEIYNSFTLPVSLGGVFVTDDAINFPEQNPIAPLSFIGGNGFIRLIADGNVEDGSNHLNFNISKLREGLAIRHEGTTLDAVMSAPQLQDISQGRTTDGSAAVTTFQLPTPGYSNGTDLSAQRVIMDNLRITEVMYNPSGGANAPEYIELQNISSTVTLNLGAVEFVNGITFAFPADATLAPGAFTVISSATQPAFLTRYPGVPFAGTYTGQLSNGGERVRLEIEGFQLGIMDFEYLDSWYPSTDGNGAALEIVDVSAPRLSWKERSAWRPAQPNPGFGGLFAVSAGNDLTVNTPGPAQLQGTVNYGSQNPAGVTLLWTKVSGPGTVTFGSASLENTTATFSAAGTYVLRLTATGTVTVSDETVVTVGESYAAWAQRTMNSSDPLVTGMERDPDRDGLLNLMEFAMGLNPLSGSQAGLPEVVRENGILSITYQRYPASGLNYVVEASSDLTAWSTSGVVDTLVSAAGNLETWRATDTQSTGSVRRYLRVRVSAPSP